jgi:DNA-binding PadR family transcriptional regulator
MTPRLLVLGARGAGWVTTAEIQKRLVELWPAADFDRNAAHTNLPLLAEAGFVDPVERGARPTETRYEINDAGWSHIREWVAHWPPDPALREAIHAKAKLARLEELPLVIAMVNAQAERCRTESDRAQGKLLSHERLLEKVPPRDAAEQFGAEIRGAQFQDEALAWGDLAARREKYASNLRRIYDRFSAAARKADGEGT